jgi:hypothetical protein
MSTYFLFLDDSTSPVLRNSDKARIVALTGILVEIGQFNKLSEAFYNMLKPLYVQKTSDGTDFYSKIPEVHGSDMLRNGASDNEKIRVYSEIVNLIANYKLPIYRIGYYISNNKANDPHNECSAKSYCFSGFLFELQPIYKSAYFIPIMDGFNKDIVNIFSGSVQWLHSYRAVGGPGLSIANSDNIIGEVFFADSKYSTLTQVVDVISYLRCINEQYIAGLNLTAFKSQIHSLNPLLNKIMQMDEVIEINVKREDRLKGTTKLTGSL